MTAVEASEGHHRLSADPLQWQAGLQMMQSVWDFTSSCTVLEEGPAETILPTATQGVKRFKGAVDHHLHSHFFSLS